MPLTPQNIKYLIIHHSATARDTTTFEAVKRYHISLGWGDIGYHYFITANGKLYHGRPETVIGCHCVADGMNYKSLGICLAGNFEIEQPTQKQLMTLGFVIGCLSINYKISATNILGHKQVKTAATLCPGKSLVAILSGLFTSY